MMRLNNIAEIKCFLENVLINNKRRSMKDQKLLWFDSETGGTDEKTDALIQLAAIIEINGEVVDEIDLKMQALPGKKISNEAISKHGMTLEMISKFDAPRSCFEKLEKMLLKHNPYPVKTDRYIMAGYNPEFDCKFLYQWYTDIDGKYAYWKHLQFSPIDVLPTLRAMRHAGILDIPDTKLETVCAHLNIPLNAHDALSDIRATRQLTHMIYGRIFSDWTKQIWGLLGPINK
jgi:DNA polymerase III subunit epsilon